MRENSLNKKANKNKCVFVAWKVTKKLATVNLFSEFHPWYDHSTLFFIMKWFLMKWMCHKCHLKEIQQE